MRLETVTTMRLEDQPEYVSCVQQGRNTFKKVADLRRKQREKEEMEKRGR
jgi:hypothetical protein